MYECLSNVSGTRSDEHEFLFPSCGKEESKKKHTICVTSCYTSNPRVCKNEREMDDVTEFSSCVRGINCGVSNFGCGSISIQLFLHKLLWKARRKVRMSKNANSFSSVNL